MIIFTLDWPVSTILHSTGDLHSPESSNIEKKTTKKIPGAGLDIGDRMVANGDSEFGFGDCEKKSVAKLATVKFSSISFM